MFFRIRLQIRAFVVGVLVLLLCLPLIAVATFAQDVITVDDAIQGPGPQQFNYVGLNWKHCSKCGQNAGVYNQTNSWDNVADESVLIVFTGRQIAFYGVLGAANGIGAFSIDSGPETMVDFFGDKTVGNQLLWTSPTLPPARHILKIRVTGTKNESSTGAYLSLDRVDITPGPPEPTATPFHAADGIQPLTYRVTFANYSTSLDRIIMLSSAPNALHIYDPMTGNDTPINLIRPALALGLSPDGKFAAVAQNALVSYIDLVNGRLIKTIGVATKPTSIALGPNNMAYVMSGGEAFPRLITVDFSTGLVKQNDKQSFSAGLDLEIHPGGTRLYGGEGSVSPGYVAVVDISNGTPGNGSEKRLNNDYLCGKIFMSQDGSRLFTGQGVVYDLSANPAQDIKYSGKLTGIIYIRSIFDSGKAGLILAIPESNPTLPCPNHGAETADRLLVFDFQTLGLLKTLPIPSSSDKTAPGTGRFVFIRSDGLKYYLIVQSNKNSGLLTDFAIMVGDIESLH